MEKSNQNMVKFLPDCEDIEALLLEGPGGSKMSRYLDTINTEMKYTTANERNCACLVSSCKIITEPLCHPNLGHSR